MGIRRRATEADFRCIDRALGERVPLHAAHLLEPGEARRIEAHVAACHACTEDERAMGTVLGALGSLEPADLERASLEPDESSRRLGMPSLLPSFRTVLAAAVVVVVVMTAAWQRARDLTIVSEVRSLRAQVARLEVQSREIVAVAMGDQGDSQPLVPIAGFRFPGPPNF